MLEKRIIILKDYSASKPKGTLILTFSDGSLKAEMRMSEATDTGNVIILQGDKLSLYVSELNNIKNISSTGLGSDITCIIADKSKSAGLTPKFFGSCGKGSVSKEAMLKRAQERVVGDLILPEPKVENLDDELRIDLITEQKKPTIIVDDFDYETNKGKMPLSGGDNALSYKGDSYIENQPYKEENDNKLSTETPKPNAIFEEKNLEAFYDEAFDFIIDDPFLKEDTTLSDIDVVSETNYFINENEVNILQDTWENYDNEADKNSLKNRINTQPKDLKIETEQDTRKPADGFWQNYDNKSESGGSYMAYYNSVKEKLLPMLKNNEKEEALNAMIPEAEFVRVYYTKQKYYCIGIVRENNEPLYICYAVPVRNSENEPQQFEGRSRFIPINPADPNGEGYFMLFQSADNGKCIN